MPQSRTLPALSCASQCGKKKVHDVINEKVVDSFRFSVAVLFEQYIHGKRKEADGQVTI
jgi:hypothetical protein